MAIRSEHWRRFGVLEAKKKELKNFGTLGILNANGTKTIFETRIPYLCSSSAY
jgi:hypothetical protein